MAGIAGSDLINEQEVAAKYGSIRTEMNQAYSKITEPEMEVISEHLVINTLINAIQPLDPARHCCYRVIGGLLVERTIKEVLPAVQQNKERIEVVISRLDEALERKKELTDFESRYKIRIRKNDEESMDDDNKKEGSAQGVLMGSANAY